MNKTSLLSINQEYPIKVDRHICYGILDKSDSYLHSKHLKLSDKKEIETSGLVFDLSNRYA